MNKTLRLKSSFIPHPSSVILSLLGRFWLWLFGWKIHGETPSYRKFVLIAAPHTSNWDFPFMLATAYAMRVRISWFGKHTLFIPPWGWFMRKLGGIPVDRGAPHTLVMQMAENFKNSEDLVLAVPPEGTRSKSTYWSVAQPVPPSHARVATFSYTLRAHQRNDPQFQAELDMLDREIRAASFAPRLADDAR
nr:Acyltransferase [uncultured bacterium]AIA16054.1 Acyltransferase [uncultured bacterium]